MENVLAVEEVKLVAYFALGILVIGLVFLGYLYRRRNKRSSLYWGIGFISITIFLLMLPTHSDMEVSEKTVACFWDVLNFFLVNIDYNTSFVLDVDALQLLKLYRVELMICYVTAPLLTLGTIFAVLKLAANKIKFYFLFSRKVYIFSELNANSLSLAQDIRSTDKKSFLLFCKADDNENDDDNDDFPYISDAKELNALFDVRGVSDYTFDTLLFGRRNIQLFLISDDEDENVVDSIQATNKLVNSNRKKALDIYVFVETNNSERLLQRQLDRVKKESELVNRDICNVYIVNMTQRMAQNVLFAYPLYSKHFNQQAEYRVMIAGAGKLGMELIKQVITSCVFPDRKLSISIVDKDANIIKDMFYRDYPVFSSGKYPADLCEISFYESDFNCQSFGTLLNELFPLNYIVICSGDDDLNIDTSLYVHKQCVRYVIHNHISNVMSPRILARIKDNSKIQTLDYQSPKEGNIIWFGSTSELYNITNITNRFIDKMAGLFAECYHYTSAIDDDWFYSLSDEVLAKKKISITKESIVNQFSNQYAALHALYKVYILCPEIIDNDLPENAEQLIQCLNKLSSALVTNIESLQRVEHNRWSFAQVFLGFDSFDIEDIRYYLSHPTEQVVAHKVADGFMHGCIVPFEILYDLNDLLGKDFISYDIKICVLSLVVYVLYQMEQNVYSDADKEKIYIYMKGLYQSELQRLL